MKRSMVMAMDRNTLIGKAGGLPWRIPADMRHFRQCTLGCPLIVGRRTFSEDIRRPLPGREMVVVTRDVDWQWDGVYAVPSLAEAWRLAAALMPEARAACVIGGAELCRRAIDEVDTLHLTVIDAAFEGDTWFDSFAWSDWSVVDRRAIEPGPGAGTDWPLTFYTLTRAGA